MALNYLKDVGMAVIVLGCSFGVAQAAAPTPPPEPSELAAQVKKNPDGSLPPRGGGMFKGATRAPIALGWNFEVCDASQWVSGDNVHFFVFAHNTDGTFFFDEAGSSLTLVGSLLTSLQNQLVEACEHTGGSTGYFIHITNTTTFAFDSVWINYP
jgi:hypothetical protein